MDRVVKEDFTWEATGQDGCGHEQKQCACPITTRVPLHDQDDLPAELVHLSSDSESLFSLLKAKQKDVVVRLDAM